MASPFTIFRKHQKVAFAMLTVAAMIAFVFFGPWMGRGNNGSRGDGRGPEVATWKFGTIYQSDVNNRIYQRHLANEFIAGVFKAAYDKGKMPEGYAPRAFSERSDDVLNAIVLHKKAEQLGLSASDDIVSEYIGMVTENSLTGEEKKTALKSVNAGGQSRLTQDQLYDALRFELEVANLDRLLQSDVGMPLTPEQRWDYYSRLNRKATIQVLPVAVKEFMGKDKISDPPTSELQAFFEKYKEDSSSPDSPEPGFKEPVRAKFQYFQVKIEELVNEEKPKVTDEEIKQYYEKHKEQFRKFSNDEGADSSDKTKKPAAATTPDATEKPDQKADKSDKTDSGAKGAEPAKDADKSATDKTPAPPEKPAAEKAAPEKKGTDAKDADKKKEHAPTADKPSDSKPTDGKAPADKLPVDKSPATGGKSARMMPTSRQRPTEVVLAVADGGPSQPAPSSPTAKSAAPPATEEAAKSAPSVGSAVPAADAAGKDSSAKPAVQSPGETPKVDDVSGAAPKKAETSKADTAKNGDKSLPSNVEPAKTEPAKSKSSSELPDTGLKPTDPLKKIEIFEYDSLDSKKVRETIRTQLAREKVAERVAEIAKSLSTTVGSYSSKLSGWNARHEGDPPAPPDFQELAKAKGIQFGETGSISYLQASETTEIGKSYMDLPTSDGRLIRSMFVDQAYNPNVVKFKPYTSYTDSPEFTFVWWRVEFKDAFVPTFDQVKGEVLEAWKMTEARKLAKAKAKEYADDANRQHRDLKDIYKFQPNVHVSEIPSDGNPPFSWMTELAVARDPMRRMAPRLTSLPGLDKAGDDFMRTVFGLDAGSAGVAMNEPQTIAYVIQVIKFDPPEDEHRGRFLAAMANPRGDYSLATAQKDVNAAFEAKRAAIFREFEVKEDSKSATTAAASTASSPSDDSDE